MLGKVTASESDQWREQRRTSAREVILDTADRLSEARGLDGWTMRELAAAVGVKAPSLYGHFDGKPAIWDALFERGYRQMDELIAGVAADLPHDISARERLIAVLTEWVGFCQASAARYRLMFTNALPGWQPSAAAYSVSQESFAAMVVALAPAGITPGVRLDLFTAVMSGLAAQQMANDPDGDRWARLVPLAVDMFLNQLPSLPEEI